LGCILSSQAKGRYMRPIVLIMLGALQGGLLATPADAAEPLKVFSLPAILESSALLVAVEKMPASEAVSMSGGIPNLWEGERVSFPGLADVAGNAETQALRFSLKHPDLRLILTVAEGLYRIVGRRSAGISSLADLKGKRIATRTDTSAAYYLKSALAAGHLTEADVEIVASTPKEMADALIARKIDAIAIWEPEAERAALALGADAVSLQPDQLYREFYSLNTTAAALADPAKRAQIVGFVRTLIGVCGEVTANPDRAQALYATRSGGDPAVIRAAWKHHRFSCSLPAELAGIMAEQEQWMAGLDKRAPRRPEELAKLIDPSVLKEALEKR
jgi:sulfonate transport system substrate-binding protein